MQKHITLLAALLFCAMGLNLHAQGDENGHTLTVTQVDEESVGDQVSPNGNGASLATMGPAIEFEERQYDFGTVQQGEKVKYTFHFKNTGNAPLKLKMVKPSCGCTSPSWPRDPIAAGESGQIDVVFNTSGKRGQQRKSVTVTTNVEDTPVTVLILKGTVVTDNSGAAN